MYDCCREKETIIDVEQAVNPTHCASAFFFLISSPLSGFPLLRNFYVHTPPLRLYLEMYVSIKDCYKNCVTGNNQTVSFQWMIRLLRFWFLSGTLELFVYLFCYFSQ